jgi:hypothetical protein
VDGHVLCWVPDFKHHDEIFRATMWGPRSIAKLVHITPITMVYGTQITIVNGVYKPTNNWGAPHCRGQVALNFGGDRSYFHRERLQLR